VNYIFNIISALKTLEDAKKPMLIIFYSLNAPIDFLKQIDYPNIEYILFNPHPNNYLFRRANSLVRIILKTDIYKYFKYFKKIDCLYPYFEFNDKEFVHAKNKIHWLVDFNNIAFPEHYEDNGKYISNYQLKLTSNNQRIILSSYSLLNELKTYFPNYKCDVKILRFASSLPQIQEEEISDIKYKYQIKLPYFISPNQFWEHKNQMVVLDALGIIKNKNPEAKFKIIFTGSLTVNRGKGYYISELRNKVNDLKLENYVEFLGVIERNEQIALMKGSLAILQPSLYEGWSTLVEEAKALNKFIILSDLPVHKEQIIKNAVFFDPNNSEMLADLILKQYKSPYLITEMDYSESIKKFGLEILDAFLY
jgi:glycosyltransferase involved in cell wall biosynthesis